MNTSVNRLALVVAAGSALVLVWHAAIDGALIVSPPPDPMPSATPDETFAVYFAWLRSIAVHDLGVRVLGAATFLALAGLGWALTSEGSRMATAGRLLVVAGLFGALAQLIEFGGHQAAIAASASLAPAATVSMIEFFIDQVGAAIATFAWATLGVAALSAALAMRGRLALPGVILGATLVVMAAARLLDDPVDIADTMLSVVGIVLVPLWALSLLAVGSEDRVPAPLGAA